MSLDGLATAIYDKKGQHVVTSTVLQSTDEENIVIDKSSVTEIDPYSKHTNGRVALMTVLDEIVSRRAQIVEIGDRGMLVPLPIVHGVTEHHDAAGYARMIKDAFPEYFSGDRAPTQTRNVNVLLRHLLTEYQHDHAPIPEEGEPPSQLALHDYTLFPPDDPAAAAGFRITEKNLRESEIIETILRAARAGNTEAKAMLIIMAKTDARNYVADLEARGLLATTRFVQFGNHSDACKESSRYTYLEFPSLKDIFIRELIIHLPERHNISLKTPNDRSAPPFADISATFLADVWMLIHYHRTGTPKPFRNVQAKQQENPDA